MSIEQYRSSIEKKPTASLYLKVGHIYEVKPSGDLTVEDVEILQMIHAEGMRRKNYNLIEIAHRAFNAIKRMDDYKISKLTDGVEL